MIRQKGRRKMKRGGERGKTGPSHVYQVVLNRHTTNWEM